MAATAWAVHDNVKDYLGTNVLDFDSDTFTIILGLAASNMTTTSVDAYTSVTNELATANGYTQKAKNLTNPDWSEAAGTATWDDIGGDPVWTASGGSITARKAAILDDTHASDVLICSSSLSSADITATDGNTFTITLHASGIFTLA
jgi:hypothetical protein